MKNTFRALTVLSLALIATSCASVMPMDGGALDDHETTVSKCGVGNYKFHYLKEACGTTSAPVAKQEAPVAAPAAPAKTTSSIAKLVNNKIEISEQVTFKTGSAKLTPAGTKVLDEVASVIEANSGQITKVHVEGHTDQVGNPEKNMSLSEARAESVKKYLEKKGVSGGKLAAKGYGETAPKFDPKTSSKSDIAKNRRVEFTVETIKN